MLRFDDKFQQLRLYIQKAGTCLVAFSGGLDSSFLLYVAWLVLGNKAKAVTISAPYTPGYEIADSKTFTTRYGIYHHILGMPFIEKIRMNPVDKCYHCKKEIFSMITKFAIAQGIKTIFDGSNIDDLDDFRPGMKAIKELGVQSPLEYCGFSKAEIREGCKHLGLDIWDKPAFACLLSRIPTNTIITDKLLKQIEQAEQVFFDNGFRAVRVRHHGEIARIELARDERKKLFDEILLDYLSKKLKKIGFCYVAFEFEGYVTGNMNPRAI